MLAETQTTPPLLQVTDLNIHFHSRLGDLNAVQNLGFHLNHGEVLGIVGESGSGKTQTALSIMGLLPKNTHVTGSIRFDGQELTTLSYSNFNKIRGNEISMIFQDPMTSLNPYLKISTQLCEPLIYHKGLSYAEAKKRAITMLDALKIPDSKQCLKLYPHKLSGGMRQRIVIAMALLCEPKTIIADEATTALDVTIQDEILGIFEQIKNKHNTSIILITHDLGIVAGLCDRTLVMYAGNLMEYGQTDDIFYDPQHPYTIGLLNALPRIDQLKEKLNTIQGTPPNMLSLPSGCPFHPRCSYKEPICAKEKPAVITTSRAHKKACHLTKDALDGKKT